MPALSRFALICLGLISLGFGLSWFFPWVAGLSFFALLFMIVLVVVDLLVTPTRKNVEVWREIPLKLSLSDPNEVKLHIRNLRKIRFSGYIGDNPPGIFQIRDAVFNFRLKGGKEADFTYLVQPFERGEFVFKELSLRIQGLIGFTHRTWHLPVEDRVKVYPSYLQFRNYQLNTNRFNMAISGKKQQRRYGEGREFESLREYTPDDEYRKINWKATARRGKPIVTQYRIERNQNIIICVDAGRMMRTHTGKMSKLDFAVNSALMLSFICIHKEDNVGLMIFNDKVQTFIPPARGQAQMNRINEALYKVRVDFSEPNYREAFYYLKRKISKRSLVLLITDLIDERASKILIREFTSLYPRHLPLCVSLKDLSVEGMAQQVPDNYTDLLEMGVAQQLIEERFKALRSLQLHGVLTLDTDPENLTADAINKYLEIKAKSLI